MKTKCKRCEYEWVKRIEGRPKRCPNCKSPYWDKARKRDKPGGGKKVI